MNPWMTLILATKNLHPRSYSSLFIYNGTCLFLPLCSWLVFLFFARTSLFWYRPMLKGPSDHKAVYVGVLAVDCRIYITQYP